MTPLEAKAQSLGWTQECRSPLEYRHTSDAFLSGQAARVAEGVWERTAHHPPVNPNDYDLSALSGAGWTVYLPDFHIRHSDGSVALGTAATFILPHLLSDLAEADKPLPSAPLSDEALEALFEELGHSLTIESIAITHDTLEDFATSAGRDWSYRRFKSGTTESGLTWHEYTEVQVVKGTPRQTLLIVNLGEVRACIKV